jgi:ribosome biogenesis protein ERB1
MKNPKVKKQENSNKEKAEKSKLNKTFKEKEEKTLNQNHNQDLNLNLNQNQNQNKNEFKDNEKEKEIQKSKPKPNSNNPQQEKLLNKKNNNSKPILDLSQKDLSDDSSDEELLVRTGNVPRHWYDEYDHSGYDIKAQKVIKPPTEDNIEEFLKKAEDKNWWRNVYDEMNNKTIFISDKDIELIKRIRKNVFANKNAEIDDYFEKDVPKFISPVSSKLPWKRSFGLSRHETKAINRLRRAIKRGDLKLNEEKKDEDKIYDIWAFENTNPITNNYNPGKGYQAPKRELPDTELSYNPPENWVDKDNNDLKQFDALRKIPKYPKILDENYERCCDLVMSSRFIKKKTDMKIEDILPTLPKPDELKPFPTKENITYKGHSTFINSMICDPSGKFLVSGDKSGEVIIWDIVTAKILKKIDLDSNIISLAFNTVLNLITVTCKEKIFFIMPPFLEKKIKLDVKNVIDQKIKPLIKQKNEEDENENEDNNEDNNEEAETTNDEKEKNNKEKSNTNSNSKKIFEWKIPKENSQKEKSGVCFYLKMTDGIIQNLNWHKKGDYFSVLATNKGGKATIYIHSLSSLVHQKPFSKIKGIVNTVCFHPIKPYFIVATNSNIFVYNLQKQVKYY